MVDLLVSVLDRFIYNLFARVSRFVIQLVDAALYTGHQRRRRVYKRFPTYNIGEKFSHILENKFVRLERFDLGGASTP